MGRQSKSPKVPKSDTCRDGQCERRQPNFLTKSLSTRRLSQNNIPSLWESTEIPSHRKETQGPSVGQEPARQTQLVTWTHVCLTTAPCPGHTKASASFLRRRDLQNGSHTRFQLRCERNRGISFQSNLCQIRIMVYVDVVRIAPNLQTDLTNQFHIWRNLRHIFVQVKGKL